jgi:hypothetical protein
MTFLLSIETPAGVRQHGFHLGTIEATARQLAEERFANTPDAMTVALLRNGAVFDVYYGRWQSEEVL